MRNSFELALDHLGRKIGGLPVEVIYEDDQFKPDVGVQKTQKLIESDKVDFMVGYIWSNVLLASLKPIVDSKTFTVVTNAGASQLAGELCSPLRVLDLVAERPDAAGDRPLHEPEGRQDRVPDRTRTTRPARTCWPASRRPSRARSSARSSRAGPTSSISRPSCRRRAPPSRTRSSCSIRAPPACSSSLNTRSPASRARSRSTPPSPSTSCRCRG